MIDNNSFLKQYDIMTALVLIETAFIQSAQILHVFITLIHKDTNHSTVISDLSDCKIL